MSKTTYLTLILILSSRMNQFRHALLGKINQSSGKALESSGNEAQLFSVGR